MSSVCCYIFFELIIFNGSFGQLLFSHFICYQFCSKFYVQFSTVPPYRPPFDETGVIVSATIIFLFLVLGLIGNGLTIAVILSYKALR